jgi:hypothetical protein
VSPADRVSIALDSLPGAAAMATVPPPFDPTTGLAGPLSALETALILRKRSVMATVRTTVRRIRQQG